jgi:glutamyl-tRNA synthetase/glutamyl-Q tRNA(Asp) synthetase
MASAHRTTRFAPSPTGWLHLGHVANAVWTWETARAAGARVVLRMEDHDRGRCRPEYERQIYEDLAWLGLVPEPESVTSLRLGRSPWRQSDSTAVYEAALDRLARAGLVYGCDCSRSTIAAQAGDEAEGVERRYPGTCRDRGLSIAPGIGIRIRLPETEEVFDDLRLGRHRHRPHLQCGDLLARDRLGNWTYQFAVAVDDLRHGVDLIVRGEDLLESTGRQILLARLLGRMEPPRFLHHPIIRNEAGVKLSKKDRATGLREMREAGMSADEVLAVARRLTGGGSEK